MKMNEQKGLDDYVEEKNTFIYNKYAVDRRFIDAINTTPLSLLAHELGHFIDIFSQINPENVNIKLLEEIKNSEIKANEYEHRFLIQK